MAPGMPSTPSVRTRLAPRTLSSFLRSRLIVSGIVSVIAYPRDAATNASAMPVLPLVGSMISLPGTSMPPLLGVPYHRRADAALDRVRGVAPLDLGENRRRQPLASLLILTSGVLPMDSELSAYQFVMSFLRLSSRPAPPGRLGMPACASRPAAFAALYGVARRLVACLALPSLNEVLKGRPRPVCLQTRSGPRSTGPSSDTCRASRTSPAP